MSSLCKLLHEMMQMIVILLDYMGLLKDEIVL